MATDFKAELQSKLDRHERIAKETSDKVVDLLMQGKNDIMTAGEIAGTISGLVSTAAAFASALKGFWGSDLICKSGAEALIEDFKEKINRALGVT